MQSFTGVGDVLTAFNSVDGVMLCPRCRSGDYSRSPRRGWMRWLPGLYSYRCEDCGAEFCAFFKVIPFLRVDSLGNYILLVIAILLAVAILLLTRYLITI